MIIVSQITLLRGNKPLLEEATATIHPGQKVGLVGKNGCGKSSLFALLKGELAVDAGSVSVPAQWQIATVAQETPALDCSALDYVIDGDKEFRNLELQLQQAEQQGDGIRIADLRGRQDAAGNHAQPADPGRGAPSVAGEHDQRDDVRQPRLDAGQGQGNGRVDQGQPDRRRGQPGDAMVFGGRGEFNN